uniref:Uncharacterized protein n=1 Tax=Branchiostoma floridae TaxID=7739 RepID=C3ZMQ0_BRAFL|eukprot:XP_002590146.1 hypothetical protein BRAFLDRAFT_126053 [Branchiostoma floridae]
MKCKGYVEALSKSSLIDSPCYKGQRSEDQGRLALRSPTPPSPCRSVQLTPPTAQGTDCLTLSPSNNRDARDTPPPSSGTRHHQPRQMCGPIGPVGGLHKL